MDGVEWEPLPLHTIGRKISGADVVGEGGEAWMPSTGEKDRGGDGGLKTEDDEQVYSFMVFKDDEKTMEDAEMRNGKLIKIVRYDLMKRRWKLTTDRYAKSR